MVGPALRWSPPKTWKRLGDSGFGAPSEGSRALPAGGTTPRISLPSLSSPSDSPATPVRPSTDSRGVPLRHGRDLGAPQAETAPQGSQVGEHDPPGKTSSPARSASASCSEVLSGRWLRTAISRIAKIACSRRSPPSLSISRLHASLGRSVPNSRRRGLSFQTPTSGSQPLRSITGRSW